ncbi:MAG: T9SS type A sorting domain-containing protein [Bacteroidales bacterium]|nr:T9SS type A sorting domain-containing protein [Bacteroidales bacterium]
MLLPSENSEFEINGIGENDTITILNEQGKQVDIKIVKLHPENIKIQVDGLGKGVYFLMINDIKLDKIILN